MNPTHVSPLQQAVKRGDKGGDQYDSMVCVGYQVSVRHPGMPYTQHGAWWHITEAGPAWYFNPPTGGMAPVPDDLDITPIFLDKEEIEARRQEEPLDIA